MIDTLERCRLQTMPFRIKRGRGGVWYVEEDYGCGDWKVIGRCYRQSYADAMVLGLLTTPEMNWPPRAVA